MFTRLILTFIFSLCLLNNICLANNLPSKDCQNEIKWQLLELAVANFDNKFADQFDRVVTSSQNNEIYARELLKGFYLIKSFRSFYANQNWSSRQNFDFMFPIVRISENDVSNYNTLVKNGLLFSELNKLRPRVPYYQEYRKAIKIFLTADEITISPYKFQVISSKNSGNQINVLKTVLKAKGYLDSGCPENGIYDIELEAAIKSFQKENGIVADGIVGVITYRLLFKSNKLKALQLARSLLRINDDRLQLVDNYVLVNIPDAQLHVYEKGKNILDSRVIVGKLDAQTPRLDGVINTVVLNPTWTVPFSIKKEYLAKLRHDPYFLQKKGIWIVDKDNNIVEPSMIDPKNFDINKFHYRMVQDAGLKNALGLYKFNFPNSMSIYLHSTSQPSLFKKQNRALSSGCIRVEKAKTLAEYLLQNTIFTPTRIEKVISSGQTKWAPLSQKTNLFIAYWTAYIGQNGSVYFKDDIYNIDTPYQNLPNTLMKHF